MSDLQHPCERWAEPLSLAAAGCLSSDEEQEVRRHVETCSDCREQFRQLTELCRALAEAPSATDSAEAAIVERIMSAVTADVSRRPIVRTREEMIHPTLLSRSLHTRRWIMRSPVSRISAAALSGACDRRTRRVVPRRRDHAGLRGLHRTDPWCQDRDIQKDI